MRQNNNPMSQNREYRQYRPKQTMDPILPIYSLILGYWAMVLDTLEVHVLPRALGGSKK